MKSNAELYVVTGVSGRTGAATARSLLKAGKKIRVVVRDAAKGHTWANQGAQVAIADLTDVSALSHALRGSDGVYIISPQQYARDDLFSQADFMANAIAKAAIEVQLPKLVALSSVGAEQTTGTGWITMNRSLEQQLTQTGIPTTFLRAAYFMENWDPLVQDAATQGALFSFLAPQDRKLPMIATEDIGRIAAEVLSENWEGTRIIELQGPDSYSPNNVAEHLTERLGRTIATVIIPELDWPKTLLGKGLSSTALAGFVEMTQSLNSEHIAFRDTPDIERRRGTISLNRFISSMAIHSE